MNKWNTFLAIGLSAIGTSIAIATILAVFVWLLWNWLCPELFGLPRITCLQAWGLAVLCEILFKGQKTTCKGAN